MLDPGLDLIDSTKNTEEVKSVIEKMTPKQINPIFNQSSQSSKIVKWQEMWHDELKDFSSFKIQENLSQNHASFIIKPQIPKKNEHPAIEFYGQNQSTHLKPTDQDHHTPYFSITFEGNQPLNQSPTQKNQVKKQIADQVGKSIKQQKNQAFPLDEMEHEEILEVGFDDIYLKNKKK